MKNFEQWNGFKGNRWKEKIDVRNFIGMNYTPYDGDASFLEGPTEATNKLWGKLQALQKEERAKGGVLDMETEVVTSLTAYGPGYIDEETKDLEKVVGLQTDKPLKRAFMPYGGIKMAEQACETYGYKVSDKIKDVFHNYEFKTHNQGVFDIYTPEMLKARHNKILTGLPDTYGRGRIVGDYRRVALYGIDYLIEKKKADFTATNRQGMRRGDFQLREEIADQVRALQEMKEMAQSYGYDISEPAKNAKEAAAVEAAVANAEMDIPDAMVDFQVDQMVDEFKQRLSYQGLSLEQYVQFSGQNMDALRENMKGDALKRVQGSLVLEAIVAAENIEANEEDLKKEFEKMAQMYQMEASQIEGMIPEEQKENMKKDIAVQKAVEFVLDQANVTEATEELDFEEK